MKKLKLQNSNVPSISEAFVIFIDNAKLRNLTPISIKSYNEKIEPFIRWAGNIPAGKIDETLVADYQRKLLQDKIAESTLLSYMQNVRVFAYFCMKRGWCSSFSITLPKVEKPVKETYSDEELRILLKKPDLKKCTFAEYRTWVFESYLMATGSRLSTCLNLQIKDLDFDNQLITLRKVKNRKQQVIPMSTQLSVIFKEYLKIRGSDPDMYIFCNCYGEKAASRSYQDAVRRYNNARGIERTSIHAFRHTFAKHWILAGGDVFRLQKIMGHSDLSVTRNYVNLFGADLQKGFDDFNPLEHFTSSRKKLRI